MKRGSTRCIPQFQFTEKHGGHVCKTTAFIRVLCVTLVAVMGGIVHEA